MSPNHRKPEHPGPIEPWPGAEYDAVLHLLDRQLVDVDGMLLGKVDDLELAEEPDGTLVPTALLVGAGVLLPRFGERLGRWLVTRYAQIAVARGDRTRPGVIELDLVEDVTSEVHLRVARDGLLHPRIEDAGERAPGPPVRRTLGELLRMRVELPAAVGPAARGRIHVLDARLSAAPDRPGTQWVAALIVGRGGAGSLLGYERSSRGRGPWLVATVVRWLHRHTRIVRLGHDAELDWEAGVVRVGPDAEVGPLPG